MLTISESSGEITTREIWAQSSKLRYPDGSEISIKNLDLYIVVVILESISAKLRGTWKKRSQRHPAEGPDRCTR
jgi:hypothetical protein